LQLLKSKIVRDGIALLSGNVWAQGITFAAYLVLVRLFSPDDIGLYNIFYSYIDILIIVSTCRYELATVIADNDREASAVSRLAFRINVYFSLFLALALLALCLLEHAIPSFSTGLNYQLALLVPPMVFFCGTTRVYAAIFNRLYKFKGIALSEIIGSSSAALLKVLFGLPRLAGSLLHNIGLPLGTVLGKAMANINYLLGVRRLVLPSDITTEERRATARRFRNFPLYNMPKELVNSISYNLPFIWMALYFDKAEVGLFALALTFTFRPANILNTVFEKLLYVRISDKVHKHMTIRNDISRFVKILNVILIPIFTIAFIWGDDIFSFVFGERWRNCGYYLRCMLPWVFVMLSSSSLAFLANIFSRQRTEFIFYLLLFALRIASILIGITANSFRLGIALFATSGTLVSIATLTWYLLLVRRYEHSTAL